MTELSFLIELLLDHKLTADTRKRVAERIKEVERTRNFDRIQMATDATPMRVSLRGPVEQQPVHSPRPVELAPPEPVAVIAQNAITAEALRSRERAMKGEVNPETGRPRKF